MTASELQRKLVAAALPLLPYRYVTVDEEAGRALFYVLAEAVDEPPAAAGRAGREGAGAATKPLLLWLNGCGLVSVD